MTIEEFLETYNLSPLSPDEVARLLTKVKSPKLRKVGKDYINAMETLYEELERIGFEFG